MKFKKPKFWDFNKPNWIAYLLTPLTIPIRINNYLLNLKTKKYPSKIFTICVGNIYVGGTGKTPTTIKLYKILNKLNFRVFVGKKFYADHKDEQIILKKTTNLISSNDRSKIIEKIKDRTDVVIFDDGLQDKNLTYDLKFVCFDGIKWTGNGLLLPSGPLRENLDSLKKYDGIFLKNYENFSLKIIKKINPKIKIFFTNYKIINLNKFKLSERYVIFSAIGNPSDFKNILIKNKFLIIHEVVYPDHYNFSTKDIRKIKKIAFNLDAKIITTEKDYVKIPSSEKKNINFIKIDLKIKNEKLLIKYIKSKLNDKY